MSQKKGRSFKRREFLAGVAALPLLGARDGLLNQNQASGNDPAAHAEPPLRLGIIGYGNRGEELCRELLHSELNTEILALCEVFDQRLQRGLKAGGDQTRPYGNYLDLLDEPDIDAVVIAAPDHWHAQMAMDAARRGKHIYLETCLTRTLDEAKALKDEVKKSEVIFQLGFQGRQRDLNLKARELLATDIIGKISLIETTTNRNDPEEGWKIMDDEMASTENIDWEQFQKPLEAKHPFSPERYYGWRNYWEYGNGMSGDLLSNELEGYGLDAGALASMLSGEGQRARQMAPSGLGLIGNLLDDEGDGLDAGDLADAGKKLLGGFLGRRK